MKTPLRYGEPLYEMIGAEVAQDYLRFVLEIAATGLLEGRSEALIRDRVRAELFTHFRSAEQRFLGECASHAEIVARLAAGLRAALRRIAGTEIFCRIAETADDAADGLEDAAFLAGLLFASAPPASLPEPLLLLADLLAEGSEAFRRTMEAAQYVRRGGERDAMQRFLEAADRIVAVEHQTDERERAVVASLMATPLDPRQLYMLGAIAHHLETAADALLHAGLKLRDHILGEATFA